MRRKYVAGGLCGLAVVVMAAQRPAGMDRKCVAAFCVEGIMLRSQSATVPNRPQESRGMSSVPGSMVPIGKDGRPRAAANKPADVTGPQDDEDQWIAVGLFRVWDDGQIEEMRRNVKSGKRIWLPCD